MNTARQMIRYENGEVRVIDTKTMTASEFLHHSERDAALDNYELDCDLDGRDLDQNFTVIR